MQSSTWRTRLPLSCVTIALATAVADAAPAATVPVPIDFSSSFNDNYGGLVNGQTFPRGELVFGGVPFSIPLEGLCLWNATIAPGANPKVMESSPDLPNVTAVHALIVTGWGQPGPTAYASIEFFGDLGAYHKKDLIGNNDIRDHNQRGWTNAINGSTTINVWNNGLGQRIDKQFFDLPLEFCGQSLTQVRVSDWGAQGFQRVWLIGLTAIQVADVAPADFDCSGAVDGADLGVLLAAWGTAGADLDGDGVTNGSDLGLLLAAWTG